ncbi:FG-GAP-like repeat-containing protein [Nannocystis pusilla]|uniref:FG-GAP-like repeat-containing protein n=1 Tax=Nannocystis pusilla TaxID=889268 RepID=UPI003DA218A3
MSGTTSEEPTPTTGASSTGTETPVCGDGQVDPGEACDDGDANGDGTHCSSACIPCAEDLSVPLVLLSRAPAGEGVAFAHDGVVTLRFGCTVDPASVNATTIVVHGSHSGRREFTVAWGEASEATLALARPLLPGERVDVTLTSEIRDLGGQAMNAQVFHFTVSGAAGSAAFTASDVVVGSGYPLLGDIDGDLDVDIVRSNGQVFVNQGDGTFTEVGHPFSCDDFSGNPSLADVDGDGDLDLLCPGGSFDPASLWYNDGAGGFTEAPAQEVVDATVQLIPGDVDGDGDLDLWAVKGFTDTADSILLNDGTGVFTLAASGAGSVSTRGIALGDLDGDGDLDAAYGTGNTDEQGSVWLNDGAGGFTGSAIGLGTGTHAQRALEIGELNGDGAADLVLMPHFEGGGKLWFGDGRELLVPGPVLNTSYVGSVLLRDLDGDGDVNVLSTNDDFFIKTNLVWKNAGDGSFAEATQFGVGGDFVALGDLDGDGVVDAIVDETLFIGG